MPAITIPGATTFTRIPWPASSRAIERASIRTPAFETEYAEISGHGISPTHEPVKMIWPRVPRSTISRAAAWPTLKHPVTLTSRCACHCSCVTSRNGADSTMPALPIATSSGSIGGERRIDRGTVGDVHLQVRAGAGGADCRDPVGRLGFRNAVEHRHVRAAARELARHRAAEVTGCAGDGDAESREVAALCLRRHGRRRRERVPRSPAAPRAFGYRAGRCAASAAVSARSSHGLARPEQPVRRSRSVSHRPGLPLRRPSR